MVSNIFSKVFGSRNERLIKRMSKAVASINALEPEVHALSDEQLRAKTDEFRKRLDEGAKLDELLPEAFAVVRETGLRALDMRHFDVQLIGGMVLNQGRSPRCARVRARPSWPPWPFTSMHCPAGAFTW